MNKTTVALSLATLLLAACGPRESREPASTASHEPAGATPARAASVPASPAAPATSGFDRTLELQGITFRVTCPNASSLNKVTITPGGLEVDNTPVEREADGTVVGAEVADLDVDGSPEIYVYVQSAGSGSYGSLIAFSANRRKSLSEIHLPPVADDPKASEGYMGHDEFAVVGLTLVQRFPLYGEGDPNARPSGKTRQLQYKLKPGEAGWVLRRDKVVEY